MKIFRHILLRINSLFLKRTRTRNNDVGNGFGAAPMFLNDAITINLHITIEHIGNKLNISAVGKYNKS